MAEISKLLTNQPLDDIEHHATAALAARGQPSGMTNNFATSLAFPRQSNKWIYTMDRLSLFVAMMTWTLVSGVFIVLFMTLGYIGWVAFAMAVVMGFGVGLPLAKVISARIKRQDPDWDEKRNRPGPTPDAEVEMDDGEPRRRI